MFPYLDVSEAEVKSFANVVVTIERVGQVITHNQPSKRTLEAVTIALRFLQDHEHLTLTDIGFCECMAFGAEAVCYASAFGIPNLLSIELTEESKRLASIYIKLLHGDKLINYRLSIIVSRFQERMGIDAEVNYLDLAHTGDLDEGVILVCFLNCCRKLLPGNYAIVLARATEINLEDYSCDCLDLVLHSVVAKGTPFVGNMFLFKRKNMDTDSLTTLVAKSTIQSVRK